MKTGFSDLDKIIDISKPQVIVMSGTNADILSGDIANNICLKQEKEVLEIVRWKKEYLIKRLLINESNVDYKKWSHIDKYTLQELQQIGQTTVNLIEVTKRLPTIIEQDMYLYDLKNVTRLVWEWANDYADRTINETLVVLDISPLNSQQICKRKCKNRIIRKFVKDIQKISKKLNTTIILVCAIDIEKKYNQTTHQPNYIKKQDIEYVNSINKYVDEFIILNVNKQSNNTRLFDIDIYNQNNKINSCKLAYDYKIRKFRDYLSDSSKDKEKQEQLNIINLDEIINEPSLNIIAGRPAMGKSTLAFNIAVNIAQKEKVPIAIFSLEISKEYINNKIINNSLVDTKIIIEDTPGISVENIRKQCIRLKQEENIGLVVIDYLQLISTEKKTSREQELSNIGLSLKKLAEELKIPILVTSQLSKEPERRYKEGQDPRPTLKDFGYSSDIIKCADKIMLLYKDDYYNPNSNKKNILEINIAKNKNGRLGTIVIDYNR